MTLTLRTNPDKPSLNSLNTGISHRNMTPTTLKHVSLFFILLLSCRSVSAQFGKNHQYVLGGSLQVSDDLEFLNLRAGRVLDNENVVGLSVYSNNEILSGISAWYRITKELEVISFPIFYKMDGELGYFDDESIGLFFSPGFTIPLTKRSYLDLSIAAVRLHYESEFEALVSLNNVSIGLVFGI